MLIEIFFGPSHIFHKDTFFLDKSLVDIPNTNQANFNIKNISEEFLKYNFKCFQT